MEINSQTSERATPACCRHSPNSFNTTARSYRPGVWWAPRSFERYFLSQDTDIKRFAAPAPDTEDEQLENLGDHDRDLDALC